jgi:alkylhydroperoxidase family enzyme
LGSEELVEAVLADWRTAPIDEKLRAMLGYLEAVTLRPGEVTATDADAVRAAGVSDQGMVDALLVCAYFNLIDRLADSFAFTPISRALGHDGLLRHEAEFLERGYV